MIFINTRNYLINVYQISDKKISININEDSLCRDRKSFFIMAVFILYWKDNENLEKRCRKKCLMFRHRIHRPFGLGRLDASCCHDHF